MSEIKVAVIQDGARLHYAVPLAFQHAGMLNALYTDWYNRRTLFTKLSISLARLISASNADRMQQRRVDQFDNVPIYDYPLLFHGIYLARKPGRIRSAISQWSIKQIRSRERRLGPIADGKIDLVFAFSNLLDIADMQWIKNKGCLLIVDQPLASTREMSSQRIHDTHYWPGWEEALAASHDEGPQILHELQTSLWADHITCASDYVKKSLMNLEVNPKKISVVPYPLDATPFPFVDRSGRTGPVTVGIVGTVNLRKGAPVVLQIAKRFSTEKLRFVWVGIPTLSPQRTDELRKFVDLIGPVPRSQIPEWLGKFDIFLLASRSEGSAGALMEAMATGLPVVTTTNSGTVARDGIEGYIRGIDDIDGLATAIEKLSLDAELRLSMGRAARQRVLNFNIEWYSRSLADLATQLFEKKIC
ncbi:MAG TPA: glycosyltransferase family 4 protein [Phycisphaerae bacterium]|nr:glycosyltransferase family 4 protein [Phycisphaerae bacterium]